jgi:hypothetical protein
MQVGARNRRAEFERFGRCHIRWSASSDKAGMNPRPHFGKPASSQRQDSPLLEQLNLHHPLIVLAKLVGWTAIVQVAHEAVRSKHRRPALRPCLISDLLYLPHSFDLSDEEVVWGWLENPYIWTVTGEQPLFP